MKSTVRSFVIGVAAIAGSMALFAQQSVPPPPNPSGQQAPQGPPRRPASPMGTASTQVGGQWVAETPGAQPRYTGGRWIEVTYSRPILRERRDIFGRGPEYGRRVYDGAPVWRAGANQTTRFYTEAPLAFGGKVLEPGEYSVFVDLKPAVWTLIFSKQPHQQKYDPNDKLSTWGSSNYDRAHDVLRVRMAVVPNRHSVDEFTIGFINMTRRGGTLAMWWERTMATASFTVADLPPGPGRPRR